MAPHKYQCYRKLCLECLFEHEVDIKQTVPLKKFQEMVIMRLKEYKIDQTSELTKQKMNFKLILSQTQIMLMKIWEELQESIQQIYDIIEIEDKSYIKIINHNINPAEFSNTDLEKLKLEKLKNFLDQKVKNFCEKLKKEFKDIVQFNKIEPISQVNQIDGQNSALTEILASLKDIDVQKLTVINNQMRREKISDIVGFLSVTQKQLEQYFGKKNAKNDLRNNIKSITDVIKIFKNITLIKTIIQLNFIKRLQMISSKKQKKIIKSLNFQNSQLIQQLQIIFLANVDQFHQIYQF
ncbi:unnamed protein product [Paramecium pentaurelia]|uniref:Uncharacterized protein n=1 Tax=Paramecium pentaurelia TaxID=43138 RepID=A0A8S1U2W6_9CILI|nr:unnamed protein product [Paramecium pentaurelia]